MQIPAEIKQIWSNYKKGLIEAEKLSYLFSILKPNFSECLCKIKKSFQFFKNVKKREKLRDLQFGLNTAFHKLHHNAGTSAKQTRKKFGHSIWRHHVT